MHRIVIKSSASFFHQAIAAENGRARLSRNLVIPRSEFRWRCRWAARRISHQYRQQHDDKIATSDAFTSPAALVRSRRNRSRARNIRDKRRRGDYVICEMFLH